MSDQGQSLEARIKRLEDIEEVQALCIAYGHFMDQRDFESYANLFSETGVWVGPPGEFKGPSEILTMLQQVMGPSSGPSCHILTNPIVDINGNLANARVTWSYVIQGAYGAPQNAHVGHYVLTFVREGDRWKLLRREGSRDIPPAEVPTT